MAVRAGNVAGTLDQFRAAPAANVAMLYEGATFTWTPGDHSTAPLGPGDDVNVVKHNDTPLTTGAWVRRFDVLSVRSFGAVTGLLAAPAANTAAFKRAITAAVALGFPLNLDGGTYLLDADGAASGGVNFARGGLHIKGGGATLRFSGRGRAFVLDQGGDDGSFLEAMSIDDIVIIGGPGVTDGFYSRGVVRSAFRNIEVRDVGGKAFHIKHGVSNHYDGLKYSPRARAGTFATHALYIDNNGPNFYSTNCVFTNAVMENFPGVGCQLEDATGLLFSGGTFEACAIGLRISPASNDNMFVKVWMELNSAADAIISGNNNGFVGGKFTSASAGPTVRILADAHGTWFTGGGYIRAVDMAAGSSGTSFLQVGVDEDRAGTIGFQGPGSFTRINCKKIGAKNRVTGAYDDIVGPLQSIGASGAWTPVLMSGRGSITPNTRLTQGTYQKIGRLVFAQCFIYVDNVRAPAGDLSIAGLPFVSACRQPGSVHATQLAASATNPLQVRADPGRRDLALSKLSAGAATPMAADIRGDTTLTVSITYTATE